MVRSAIQYWKAEPHFGTDGLDRMIGNVSDIALRLLRIFATVAESGGFAVATAKLNVAESTVSQHMSDLEKRIGLRLCERGRAGFRLTKSGEEVYRATLELLQDLDGLRAKLSSLPSSVSGRIALGLPDAISTMEDGMLTDALRRFSEKAPELHLQIEMLTPRELERQVIDGKIAAAVAPAHRRGAGLDYRPLFGETNLLYCGDRHRLFAMPDSAIGAADLESGGRITRGYLEHFDAAFFDSEDYAATVHVTEAAALLILTGRYIGCLPDHYARDWVRANRMRARQPQRYHFTSEFNLITRREAKTDGRVGILLAAFESCGQVNPGPFPASASEAR